MQRDIFMDGEGHAWIARNPDAADYDPVSGSLQANHAAFAPKAVLEIGCGNGWRLEKLLERYPGAVIAGVDPGTDARQGPPIYVGKFTADSLPLYENGMFDLIIFGFCLYLCDPEDYFRIVCGADRVLADGGLLVIHDFYHADYEPAFRTPYVHREGVWSHHAAFWKLWEAHPAYRVISTTRGDRDDAVYVMRKDLQAAFGNGDVAGATDARWL